MSVRQDFINLFVNVKGDAAKNELNQLQKEAAKLSFEMKGLKKGTQEYTDAANKLATVTNEITTLNKQIGITSMSQRQLVSELKRLQQLKGNLTPQTKEFNDLQKEIEKVTKRLYEVKNGVFGFSATLHKIKAELGGFGAAAVAALGFQFISDQFSNIIKGAGKLSDSLANIRKVTGLSIETVKEMNAEFGKMDTRTSTEGLRDLAAQAGKVGVEGKENILAFVRAGDQLKVALGEDLGENAVQDIGKLVDIFRIKEKFGLEQSMLKVGSAINDVGASSSATESYLVDFLKRMGGIGPTANITIPQLVALGGTLDSLGQTSETSSTAIGNTLGKLVTDFDGFAKIAGISGDALRKAFQDKGGLEALKLVLQGVKNTGGGFDSLVAKLGDVGIEGAKAKGVFAVLANNLDVLDKQVGIANNSFDAGTSVTAEYNVMNATLGATLDKLGKEFNRLVTSPAITGFLTKAAEGAVAFIKILRAIPEWLQKNATQAKIFLAVMAAFNALRIAALIQGWIGQLLLLTLSMNASGLATKLLAAATRLLQLAFAAAIGAAAVLLYNIIKLEGAQKEYIKSLSASASHLRVEAEARKTASAAISEELSKVAALVIQINNHNNSKEKTALLLKQLIAINPELLKGLTAENITRADGIEILTRYRAALMATAIEQAKAAMLSSKLQKSIEFKMKYNISDGGDIDNQLASLTDGGGKNGREGFGSFLKENVLGIKSAHSELVDEVHEFKKTLVDIETLSTQVASGKLKNDLKTNENKTATAPGATVETKAEKAAKAKQEREAKANAKHLATLHKQHEKAGEDRAEQIRQAHKLLDDAQAKTKSRDAQELVDLEQKYSDARHKAKGNAEALLLIDKAYDIDKNKLLDKQRKRAIDEEKARVEERKKLQQEYLDKQYKDEEDALADWFSNEKQMYVDDYAKGAINKELYEEKITEIELKELKARLENAVKFGKQDEVKKYQEQLRNLETQMALKQGDKFANGEGVDKKETVADKLWKDARKDMLNAGLELYRNYTDSLNAMDEKRLRDVEAKNNVEKNRLSRMLRYNMISRGQFDKLSEKADEKANAKKKELTDAQFYRNQKIAASNALINEGLAISEIWAKYAANPIAAGILTALAVATLGQQISTINAQEPPVGRQGLLIDGPSHEGGGVDMVERKSGRKIANVEGGEPLLVLSRNTMANNGDVIRKLYNSSRHLNGAPIDMPNANKIVPMMGQGGNSDNGALLAEMQAMRNEMKEVNTALAAMPTSMRAHVVLKDLHSKEKEFDELKKRNSVKQA